MHTKRWLWKPFLVAASALLIAGAGRAQAPLTLEAALQAAWQNSPDMVSAERSLRQLELSLAQAEAALKPSWTANATFSDSRSPRATLQGSGRLLPGLTWSATVGTFENNQTQQGPGSDDLRASTSLSWQLWPPSRDDENERRRESLVKELRLAEAGLATTRDEVAVQVTEAYFKLVLAIERAGLQKTALQEAQEQLERTRSLVALGHASEIDLLNAQNELLQAENAALSQEASVEEQRRSLAATLGLVPEELVLLPYSPGAFARFAATPELPPLEEAIEKALDASRSVATRQLAVDEALRSVEAQERSRLSATLSAEGTFVEGKEPNFGTFLRITYPLSDGGRSRASAEQARLSLESAEAALVQERRNVENQVRSALNTVALRQRSLASAETLLEIRRREWEAAQEQWEKGLITREALSARERSFRQAVLDRDEAVLEAWLAHARLRILLGEPIPWTGDESPDA